MIDVGVVGAIDIGGAGAAAAAETTVLRLSLLRIYAVLGVVNTVGVHPILVISEIGVRALATLPAGDWAGRAGSTAVGAAAVTRSGNRSAEPGRAADRGVVGEQDIIEGRRGSRGHIEAAAEARAAAAAAPGADRTRTSLGDHVGEGEVVEHHGALSDDEALMRPGAVNRVAAAL